MPIHHNTTAVAGARDDVADVEEVARSAHQPRRPRNFEIKRTEIRA
jgi:hypothetical protein